MDRTCWNRTLGASPLGGTRPTDAGRRSGIRRVGARDQWRTGDAIGGLPCSLAAEQLVAGLAVGLRYVVDVLMPVADYSGRAAAFSGAMMAVSLAAGFSGSWQTGRVRIGALVAMITSVVASLLSLAIVAAITLVSFDTLVRNDPDPGEVFIVPAILLAVGAVMGTVGGMFGRGLRGIVRAWPRGLTTG